MAKENQESSRKKWADFVEDVTNALFQIIFDPDNKFTKAEDSRMELIFNKYFEKLEEKAQADRRDNIKDYCFNLRFGCCRNDLNN